MNYQIELDKIINKMIIRKNLNETSYVPSKLLLHCCCAPCSSYVFQYLSQYFQITAYYYNPNIDTEEEYNSRADAFANLLQGEYAYPISFIKGEYEHSDFLEVVQGLEDEPEGGKRCEKCILLRLREAAKKARELDISYFTTTLTISPHKNAILINDIQEDLGEGFGLTPLPCDFKKKGGYQRSIQLSKEYNIYRQNYCGCEFAKS